MRKHKRHAGFTLTELLVAIGVTSILLSITVTGLRQARNRANETRCLAAQRDVARMAWLYVGDHDDRLPYVARHRRLNGAFEIGGWDFGFFEQTHYWTPALYPYAGIEHGGPNPLNCPMARGGWSLITWHGELYPSQFPDGTVTWSGYGYSTALFTGPALWWEHDPIVNASQLGPARASLVQFPAQKAMFYERRGLHLHLSRRPPGEEPTGIPITVSMMDGSAFVAQPHNLPAPVPNPFYPGYSPGPLENTRDGALGRDF